MRRHGAAWMKTPSVGRSFGLFLHLRRTEAMHKSAAGCPPGCRCVSADNVGHAFRAPRLTAPHQHHLQVASRRLSTVNNYCKLDAVFSLLPSNASCGVFKSHELSTASRFTALESSENMRSPRSYGICINVTKTQFGESSNCQIGLNRHSFHFVTSLSFRYAIRSIELHQR